MEDVFEYFSCDACSNKGFRLIHSFYLRFHGVNFSDELIYDELREEKYECTQCGKAFTKKDIEDGLRALRGKRRRA